MWFLISFVVHAQYMPVNPVIHPDSLPQVVFHDYITINKPVRPPNTRKEYICRTIPKRILNDAARIAANIFSLGWYEAGVQLRGDAVPPNEDFTNYYQFCNCEPVDKSFTCRYESREGGQDSEHNYADKDKRGCRIQIWNDDSCEWGESLNYDFDKIDDEK